MMHSPESPRSYSKVILPEAEDCPTVLLFLARRFAHVPQAVWERRILEGKVLDESRRPIATDAGYLAGKRIYYYREVEQEPLIPFAENILFQNEHLLVACKPHFLPVNPTGPFVAECLMHRLREKTGNHELVPINRIDRDTAGIVLFSADSRTRDLYYKLFREGKVEKSYQAVARLGCEPSQTEWLVENRIVPGEPWFRVQTVPGEPNARSLIRLVQARGETGFFQLNPLTGKTHQLRLHMSSLGFGILNDRYYPVLQEEREDDFGKPLRLLAKMVRFRDPVTGEGMEFVSERKLF